MKRFRQLFESPPGLIKPMEQSFTKSEHGPKKKKMEEQHREKGRFKPTIPHNVPSVLTATPKKVNEDFGKPTPSVEEVAKKHGVSVDEINKQLEMGVKVEKEHTDSAKMAREIALDHLNEKPNYYSKLKKYVESIDEACWTGYKQVGLKKKGDRMVPNCVRTEMTDVEYQSAGAGARTLVDKPNKEPLKKYKEFVKEDLRNWFDPKHPKGGWKRINAKGEAIGPCAREPGEPKPKCMSNEKRAALSKKERAAAVSAKRRHDPDAERKGKPINVSNFGKGKLSEDMEQLDEKNVPTSPEKWARAKAMAKSKFDVYPSAYANGWAAKKYKEMGGGWKSVNEERDTTEEKHEMLESQLHFMKYACEEILEYMKMGGEIEEWYQVKVAKVFAEFEGLHAHMEGESRRLGMKEETEMNEGILSHLAKKIVNSAANTQTPREIANTTISAFNKKAPGTKMHNHPNFSKFKSEVHAHVSSAKTGEEALRRSNDDHVKSLAKKHFNEEVEQIDELSKEKLGWYLRKASKHMDKKGENMIKRDKKFNPGYNPLSRQVGGATQRMASIAQASAKYMNKEEVEQLDELSNELLGRYKDKAVVSHGEAEKAKNYKLSDKRFSGVVKATNKQFANFRKKPFSVKEETEQLDELSKTTLGSYATKAADDARVKKDASTSLVQRYKGYSSKSFEKSDKADKRLEGVKKAVSRLTKEETEQLDEISAETKASYTQKATKEVEQLKPHAEKGEYKDIAKNIIKKREKGIAMAKEDKDVPFEGGTTKPKQKVVPGKHGAGYSTARHLARQAMKKQVEKMKPVKESLKESRKAEIVKEIVKKKKNGKDNSETFQKDPELSSEITKA